MIGHQLRHGLGERFEHARHAGHGVAAPKSKADVPAARERVSAELAFIGYAQGIYEATQGGQHHE